MISIEALLSDNKLGSGILKKLRLRGELPDKGIVAGGSVASVILTKAYGGNYPINDIDVFIASSDEEFDENISGKKKYHSMPFRCEIPNNKNHDRWYSYDQIAYKAQNMERSYKVEDSTQNGFVNTVKVSLKHLYGNLEDAVTILNGFDLNCCHAAIDIASEQLVVTANFKNFLETLMLKVTQPYTPIHTAMRLVKKQKELNCQCNIDHEMEYLSLVPQLLPEYNRWGNSDYARYFGCKYYETYQTYKDIIDKYFDVFQVKVKPIRAVYVKDLLVPVKFMKVDNLYGFKPKAQYNSNSLFEGCKTVPEIKILWDLLNGPLCKVEKNMRALLCSGDSFNFMIENPLYAQCDWQERQLEEIEYYLERRPGLRQMFLDMKLNIVEQFNTKKLLKKKSRVIGHSVISMLCELEELPVAITEEFIDKLAANF